MIFKDNTYDGMLSDLIIILYRLMQCILENVFLFENRIEIYQNDNFFSKTFIKGNVYYEMKQN